MVAKHGTDTAKHKALARIKESSRGPGKVGIFGDEHQCYGQHP
jgi:hypothetical protein